MEALAAPVSDRLFFAGDATSLAHLGTTQAALLSGLREAGRIADAFLPANYLP